jgi:hypothetical protein
MNKLEQQQSIVISGVWFDWQKPQTTLYRLIK